MDSSWLKGSVIWKCLFLPRDLELCPLDSYQSWAFARDQASLQCPRMLRPVSFVFFSRLNAHSLSQLQQHQPPFGAYLRSDLGLLHHHSGCSLKDWSPARDQELLFQDYQVCLAFSIIQVHLELLFISAMALSTLPNKLIPMLRTHQHHLKACWRHPCSCLCPAKMHHQVVWHLAQLCDCLATDLELCQRSRCPGSEAFARD